MKSKLLTFIAAMLLTVSANAQDLVEMIKRDINAERRTIVAEAIEIPSEKEAEFWAIYNDMEQKLGLLTEMRITNINKFAENYEEMTDDVADELATAYLTMYAERTKIYKTYYKKMAKLISNKEAARFIQVLGQIQLILDMQVAAEVPLIE